MCRYFFMVKAQKEVFSYKNFIIKKEAWIYYVFVKYKYVDIILNMNRIFKVNSERNLCETSIN